LNLSSHLGTLANEVSFVASKHRASIDDSDHSLSATDANSGRPAEACRCSSCEQEREARGSKSEWSFIDERGRERSGT